VAYQLAFTQTVNQMQYSSAIRKLGELCTELWAEKTPYLGGEIPLNAIVLTNIDNTSVMYTFDYQYDGRAALDVLDNLFLKLHAMNGNSSSFTVLIMNAEKQIIDANQRVANNNSYFLTGDMRILTPNFTGRAAYTHTDRIDLANLRDFDSLNIINTAPLAGTGIELTSVSPVKLGNMFLAGQGFKQNKAEAAYWYFKDILRTAPAGAKVGFVPFALGLYFYGGKDQAEAVAWWRKAAEQGNSDAQYYLGYAYQRGEGIARDTSEAVRWYTLAAQQGNEAAQRALTQLPAERGN
jgi:hypothetical protein